MATPTDLYDEPTSDPRQDSVAPTKGDDESDSDEAGYATFLAPKASFAGKDLAVGAVHRVRVERVLDDEVELKCIKPDGDQTASEDNAQEDSMYT